MWPGPYLTAFFIENYLNIQLNGPLVISQQAGSVNFLSLVFSRAAATFSAIFRCTFHWESYGPPCVSG